MKNITLTIVLLFSGLVMAQEVRKEVDLPNAVFDCLVKIRDSKSIKNDTFKLSGFPLKVTEVTNNGSFVKYEFKNGVYNVEVTQSKPYDFQINFTSPPSEPYFVFEFYFYNNTFKALKKDFHNGRLCFNLYSEKKSEIYVLF